MKVLHLDPRIKGFRPICDGSCKCWISHVGLDGTENFSHALLLLRVILFTPVFDGMDKSRWRVPAKFAHVLIIFSLIKYVLKYLLKTIF